MADTKNRGGKEKRNQRPGQSEHKQDARKQNDSKKRKDQIKNPDDERWEPTNQE